MGKNTCQKDRDHGNVQQTFNPSSCLAKLKKFTYKYQSSKTYNCFDWSKVNNKLRQESVLNK